MQIQYSPRFKRSFKKLHKPLQQQAWQKLETFKQNQFHPQLNTHKLQNSELYSFSVTYKIRIIFKIIDDTVLLVNIGDHSLYRKIND